MQSASKKNVESIFESIFRSRGMDFEVLEDSRYCFSHNGGVLKISLDNIRRDYERDGDEAAVVRFLDNTLLATSDELPGWEEAKDHVYPYLESTTVEFDSGTLFQPRSDKAVVMLTHLDPSSGQLRFLRADDFTTWETSEEYGWKQAMQNLDRLARETKVGFLDGAGFLLGTLEAHPPYKASLILSRELRAKVEERMGWPVYAVAPARDFVYLISKADESELGRVGAVVVKEYKRSGYPVSTEVWLLSDDGIEAVGEFPAQ
jgi:hypothetical protein